MELQSALDLIFHGSEERNLEYKTSMNWNDVATKSKVTRTAMSMANIKDGGILVFGVDEVSPGRFEARGMSAEDARSFQLDNVMDSVNKYADPFVELNVQTIEYQARVFVLIQVAEFEELPVVCKKSGVNLRRGEIYTRSRRKNESVPVSSQTEMREILEMSFDKRMRRYREQFFRWGILQPTGNNGGEEGPFQEQIAQLESESLAPVNKYAFWRILIRPTCYSAADHVSNKRLLHLLEDCSVNLAGGGFPALDGCAMQSGSDWVGAGCSRRDHHSIWRFHGSRLFIDYLALREDHLDSIKQRLGQQYRQRKGYVSILWVLHTLTAVYEFAMRLAQHNLLLPRAQIDLRLEGVRGYQLFYWNPSRPASDTHVCNRDHIEMTTVMGGEEILASGHQEALSKALYVFECFNWHNPPRQIFLEEQRKYLARRT